MNHLLLLLPLLAIPFLCDAEDATQLIYDIENREVTSEESYHVLPAEHGTGGGLNMMHAMGRCQYLVSQASSVDDIGTPVRFVPSNKSSGGHIVASANITIRFDVLTTCIQSMYWHVNSGHVVVGKDGSATYLDPLPPAFTFRIERYNNGKTKGYKLVSCADEGEGPCKDLGMSASENKNWLSLKKKNKNWLAISDSPFVVVFKKDNIPKHRQE